MTLKELLGIIREGLDGQERNLFDFVLVDFAAREAHKANSSSQHDVISRNSAPGFYQCLLEILQGLANRFANDIDDPVYNQANRIALAIGKLLSEEFWLSLPEPQIVSPGQLIKRAGLVIFKGPNGERCLRFPSKKSRRTGRRVQRQIKAQKSR